jgi:hypothetical protein
MSIPGMVAMVGASFMGGKEKKEMVFENQKDLEFDYQKGNAAPPFGYGRHG